MPGPQAPFPVAAKVTITFAPEILPEYTHTNKCTHT